MFWARFQKRQVSEIIKGFVFDGGFPAALGFVLLELHHFIHDELPITRGDLRVTGRQIRAGDLQIHSGLLLRFLARSGIAAAAVAQSLVPLKTFLLAGHVIVNVVPPAVLSFVESVSLSHNCVGSDEVTTIDLDSGKEQVGVTQGRPEFNRAGTSAGTPSRYGSFPNPLQFTRGSDLEARVGIEQRLQSNLRIRLLEINGLRH